MSCFLNKLLKCLKKLITVLLLNRDELIISAINMNIQYVCITKNEIKMINAEELIVKIIFFIKIIKRAVICFKILCRQLMKAYKKIELYKKNDFTFFLCLLPLL